MTYPSSNIWDADLVKTLGDAGDIYSGKDTAFIQRTAGLYEQVQEIVAGTTDEFVGKITIAATAPPDMTKYVGPIPYPNGLQGLSNATYPDLAAIFGDSSTLWELATVGGTSTTETFVAITYTGLAYCAVTEYGRLKYSLNGTSWDDLPGGSLIASANPTAIACNPDNPSVIVAVGLENKLWVSTTGVVGPFSQITSPLTSSSPNWAFTDIKYSDPAGDGNGVFYAVANRLNGSTFQSVVIASDVVTHTTNAGKAGTWSALPVITGYYEAVQFNGTHIVLAGYGSLDPAVNFKDTIIKSTDGTTWAYASNNPLLFAAKDINYFEAGVSDVWYAAGTSGDIYYSGDLANWVKLPLPTGHTTTLYFVRIDTVNSLIVFGGEPVDNRSYIYSYNYITSELNVQAITGGVILRDYAENGDGQSVIVGGGGKIYTFTAFGGDMSVLSNTSIHSNASTFNIYNTVTRDASGNLYAVTRTAGSCYLFYSSDSGDTWTLKQTISLTNTSAYIAYDDVNSSIVIFVLNSGTSGTVFTSSNPDTAFTNRGYIGVHSGHVTGPVCINGTLLLTDQYGTLWSAGHGDTYTSTDGGATWTTHEGVINEDVVFGMLRKINNYFVLLPAQVSGTVSGRFFYSTDGVSWSETTLPGALTDDVYVSLAFANGYYYALSTSAVPSPTIWKSATIDGTFVAGTMTTYTASTESYINFASIGDMLLARLRISGVPITVFSADGITWDVFDSDTAFSSIITVPGGTFISVTSTDDVLSINYTQNNTPDTFDIPYPLPAELAVPFDPYMRAYL